MMKVSEYGLLLDDEKHPYLKEKCFHVVKDERMEQPQNVYELFRQTHRLDEQAEEHMYTAALDVKENVLGVFELASGSACECYANMRGLFMRLLLCGAAAFVVIHNHPSNDNSPSMSDIAICKKAAELAAMMEITMCDFLIATRGGVLSFREQGMLSVKK